MKLRLFVGCFAFAASASAAFAQSGSVNTASCPPGTANSLGVPDQQRATQDACQKAIDLFQYLAPQLGTVLAGGNATLGQGGGLGGPGHFSLGVRMNALRGSLPQLNNSTTPSVTGAQRTNYTTKDQYLPLPVADLSVGIFGGLPLGLTNVGSLDAIVSASYLQSFHSGTIDVTVPSGSLKLGFGGRLGILQESILVPGVSVTYLQRDLPKVDITSNFNRDTLQVNGLQVKTKAWRVVASKSFLIFGLAVGAGKDTYNSDASVGAIVQARTVPPTQRQTAGPVRLSQDLTRTNAFADLSLNLPLLKIVGEIGQASGGSVTTYNTFSGSAADASRRYGSVGLRLGF
jgi:hypothetical protein